jgi:hypothetical protein
MIWTGTTQLHFLPAEPGSRWRPRTADRPSRGFHPMAQSSFRLALAMGSATGMGMGIRLRSEDAEFFLLAIARPDVHPARGTGPAVGGLHLVINR